MIDFSKDIKDPAVSVNTTVSNPLCLPARRKASSHHLLQRNKALISFLGPRFPGTQWQETSITAAAVKVIENSDSKGEIVYHDGGFSKVGKKYPNKSKDFKVDNSEVRITTLPPNKAASATTSMILHEPSRTAYHPCVAT
ncbi:hypothetical protein BGX26_005241 [Mortierella sp. AD094]|nr:hypothetical protein BGX26_005241 [Mortierella sp. AD094]